MARALARLSIQSHVPGVTSSRDQIFQDKSVALTGIYRAKGNEAPMVYVVNSEYCFDGFELSKRRNILFTAMTRSRAWVRIAGVGPRMTSLSDEAGRVTHNDYRLNFLYPTKEEIAKIKKLHRDMPEAEKQAIESDLEGLLRLMKRVDDGDIDPDHLPKNVRSAIRRLLPKN
ncbi:ATP-binding domain-containing protein [Sphingomonas daechungensis]|uniref:ATP-binding domain-containing protein n=1 Tax=Sphingomonas daechungensis TaxID=1176646 RepID=UPI0037833418